jgi:hypothetical protein
MTTPEHERIIQLPVAAQPLRRRRSRLGEPTVRIELVVIDSNGELGRQLLRRQAAAVKEALQWFAHHPPMNPTTTSTPRPKRDRPRRRLLRRQQVPVFDLHSRAFSQVKYCRGCTALPAGGTQMDITI